MKYINTLIVVFMFLTGYTSVFAQIDVTVQELMNNPDLMLDRVVSVEGTVLRHVEDLRDNKTYILRDRFGNNITVRTTSRLPETNVTLIVTGSFSEGIIGGSRTYYLAEVNRSGGSSTGDIDWIVFSLIGLGLIILVLIVVLLLKYKKKPIPDPIPRPIPKPTQPPIPNPNPNPSSPPIIVDNPTIKIFGAHDKTIRILPGRLTVLEGIEGQKELKFLSPPNSRNNEFTFGRNPGRTYSHFQIKSPTVSREQAKILISRDTYTLINYSQANPTAVNGEPLGVNDSYQLNSGDVISMGEVSLRFEL